MLPSDKMGDETVHKNLWRVKKTILQLCHDRGYLVTQDELDESFDTFKELYRKSSSEKPLRSKLTMLFSHSDSARGQMYVFFPTEKTIKKSHLITYCQQMQEENIDKAIFVAQETLTPVAKRVFLEFSPRFTLELFYESELLVNIMDHELVPRHIVLNNQEKEELFSRYKLSENLLMRLQSNDPVARYYGLRRGQVVKILRNSETAGRYVSYRLVL